MNDAILLQQCLSVNGAHEPWNGIFYDMLRLTQQRHTAYCRAHQMDYWAVYGDVHPEQPRGAWGKIWLILDALERGYSYVVWLDTDAAVMDFETDLRQALPEGKHIGAAEHYAAWFETSQIPRHYNVGALYFRNSPLTTEFVRDWAQRYPGEPRWMDQGAFNDLIKCEKYQNLFAPVAARFNATLNVNLVDYPAVKGWHGIMPPEKRLAMMHSELRDDWLKFRIGN